LGLSLCLLGVLLAAGNFQAALAVQWAAGGAELALQLEVTNVV